MNLVIACKLLLFEKILETMYKNCEAYFLSSREWRIMFLLPLILGLRHLWLIEPIRWLIYSFAQSAMVVEYTDCTTAEGLDPMNKFPWYNSKQSDGEARVMLEHWGIRRTHLLPSLLGLLMPGVVVTDRVQTIGQIELNCVIMLNWIVWNIFNILMCTYAKMNCLKWNCFDV